MLSAPPPPPTHPKFPSFCLGLGEAQKCFILRNQTTGDLKSHHLQARVTLEVTLTAVSVPPRPHFLSAELLCHLSNLSQLCITVYTRNIMKKVFIFFLFFFFWGGGGVGHSRPLRGGGGTWPPGPPWVRHCLYNTHQGKI